MLKPDPASKPGRQEPKPHWHQKITSRVEIFGDFSELISCDHTQSVYAVSRP